MSRFFTTLIAGAILASAAHAEVVTYPAGPGVETNNDFNVRIRQNDGPWMPIDTYPVKVDRVVDAAHHVETASMAYFDFDGTVDVEVISRRDADVKSARIRPLSFGIKSDVSADTITFSLSEPRNISIEVNGDIFHNLHLFANPIDANRPSPKVLKNLKKHKNLLYFAPGLHRLPDGVLKVASGTTVYIDGGARVVGQLRADSVENVRFFGRGIVHPEDRGEGIYISNSRNVEAEGVILTQIPVGGSDSVRIANVKSISSYGWGDGMNVFASSNVSYDRVFCRNSDDCSTVYATRKGFVGGCENILMENSTLWADVAHPIFIGLHGSAAELGPDAPADTICNVTYRNIDILDQAEKQLDYQGCLAINAGDNNIVRDITFDDIRIEDFREGQLLNFRIFYNKKYCAAPGQCINNVLVKDVTYNGSGENISIISGYDTDHKLDGITFDNLVINGRKIADNMPGKPAWYKTSDMGRIYIGEHVDNVTFK